jgi:Na+/H+-dicarboxylate symporter
VLGARKFPLHIQILIALILAIVAGRLSGTTGGIGTMRWVEVYDFIGQLFLRGLRMLVVPLIASAIITGIANLGAEHAFRRLGLKTMAYFLTTSIVAILIGLVMVNIIKPGLKDGRPIEVGLTANAEAVKAKIGDKGASDVIAVFQRMIPENVVATASDNREMLALIVFSILFGYCLGRVPGEFAVTVQKFWRGVYEVMLRITDIVMRVAPLGIFGLVAGVAATTNLREFASLIKFFVTVLLGLGIHLFIFLPLMLIIFGRINPLKHFRAMTPALLTAFSTSSSNATLPVTMECLQKNAKVSNRISSLVIPLGATVNMDGTALYECAAALFIAQVYGVELSFSVQFLTVFLALLTSIGVAGVPSASLVAIVVILTAIDLPAEAIGLIMLFDRPLDMVRTAVNVFSDTVCAVIVARTEGETEVLK